MELACIVVVFDPVLEGIIPTANVVSRMVLFDGVDEGETKSKEPTDLFPLSRY